MKIVMNQCRTENLSEGGLNATRDMEPVGVSTSIFSILPTCKSMHIEAKHILFNNLFIFLHP